LIGQDKKIGGRLSVNQHASKRLVIILFNAEGETACVQLGSRMHNIFLANPTLHAPTRSRN